MATARESLTRREREVVEAASKGGTVRELAAQLFVSPKTVEHHLSRAYRKLGVRNRTELMAKLAEPGRATADAVPTTRYAKSGGASIAYQVIGDGPRDLVLIPGFVSHVETAWTWPDNARFLRRLARGRRLIVFDKRGTGLSDPLPDPGRFTLEERVDEVRAVMDAAGCSRASLFGFSDGASIAMLFAATHAARTERVILFGAVVSASLNLAALGVPADDPDRFSRHVAGAWGTGHVLGSVAPSALEDPDGLEHLARYERHGASPAAAQAALVIPSSIEIRSLCPAVRCPTLVLHRRRDPIAALANGRVLAADLPDATLVELEGADHPPWLGDTDAVHWALAGFLVDDPVPPPPLGGMLMTLLAIGGCISPSGLAMVDRAGGRPVQTSAGTVYSFDGPVRAAECGLTLAAADPAVGVGVHVGEVRRTATGIEGTPVDTVLALRDVAVPGRVVCSGTLRELALGSGLCFREAGRIATGEAGEVAVLAVGGPGVRR